MKTPFYQNGLKFECTQCHACCRHDPGYVFLSKEDLDRLCIHFHITSSEFIQKYCRWVDLGVERHLSLLEKPNFDCIFWEEGCSVYASRPLQCRTYPFWSDSVQDKKSWDLESRFCPGIGIGKIHTADEIKNHLLNRRINPILKKGEI